MNAVPDVMPMMMLTLSIIPIAGILMAITPYLMKKSEVFAVTVPETALQDAYLKGLRFRFATTMAALTLVLTSLGVFFCLTGSAVGVLAITVVGSLLICAAGYALMLYYRQKVRLYKKEKNWTTETQVSAAVVYEGEAPKAISLKWNFLYLPIMLITLAIGYFGYDQIPDMVVRQIGFNGEIAWMDKSPFIIVLPVLIQAFMVASFVFSHWSITRSKRLTDPNAPATSALAYGMFAHAQSIYLLVLGSTITVLLIAMPLQFMGVITIMQATIPILVASLLAVLGAVALAVVYGQGGARVFQRMQENENMPTDNDQYWKLGIFYFNPEDPSLFLLERFGVGWTVNLARPAIWAILGAGLLLTIAFVVAVMLMV